MQKVDQYEADYRNGKPMKQCGLCSMYRTNGGQFGRCTKVAGNITPYGLCRYWDMLANPYGHHMTGEHRAALERIYAHARSGADQ